MQEHMLLPAGDKDEVDCLVCRSICSCSAPFISFSYLLYDRTVFIRLPLSYLPHLPFVCLNTADKHGSKIAVTDLPQWKI
jgi:hypothetical protein